VIYRFEGFSLDDDRRELRRGRELVAIEPQVFDVLEFLIVNRERVVSTDDLIRAVWRSRIVSDGIVSTRINAVRHALGDSGALQRLIRTLPRKGYRFAGDIRSESGKSRSLAGDAQAEAPAAFDRPSIAVLPFANFSGDAEQTYFADGMVDEIITALSRIKWLFVIARTSSFTYRNQGIDVRQIGRELGVRYVLEGSVRKTDNRVRIMPQLIDAQTGAHVWADRFEGALDDVFELQDRLSAQVVGAIAPKLQQVEVQRVRTKPTGSLDAYDYYLRGVASFHRFTWETTDQALANFQRAIELDPDFATPYGMAAHCYVRRKQTRWLADETTDTADAVRVARAAVEFGNDDVIALSAGGWALAYVGFELDEGIAFIDRALELGPNLAAAWIYSGWARIFRGDYETAIKHLTESMRMSPFNPLMVARTGTAAWHLLANQQTGVAFGHYFANRYDEAGLWAEKALRTQPNNHSALRIGAAAAAMGGCLTSAKHLCDQLQSVDLGLRLSNLADTFGPYRNPEHRARFAEGLRLAGLPD
jgi:TolB-like protein